MLAEAVLVRILVPMLGEKKSMRVGLAAFGFQCIVLGFAFEGWHLFVCIIFSMVGNLVYPSLTSLVSASVEPEALGEALGAVNGIKALTEGIGPLVFGSLMTLSENSSLPGSPYLLAAVLVFFAYRYADRLPDVQNDDYVHELDYKKRQRQEAKRMAGRFATQQQQEERRQQERLRPRQLYFHEEYDDDDDDEYAELLLDDSFDCISEVETDDGDNDADDERASRLPRTFASFLKMVPKPGNV
eukprot:CAMPEP_0116561460 /NCGR_PEP_ID=MMETSP0397-20121206/11597_1 /TAXON_ID=216820 /ORGANISM="Cyclophora tenuis, Strain ECT3854" /LENGTH=242 /DNA_ID=CAMNT_0004087609 /DNA_START=17 /DNA_END=742 /DNA_ORIENTATION=+